MVCTVLGGIRLPQKARKGCLKAVTRDGDLDGCGGHVSLSINTSAHCGSQLGLGSLCDTEPANITYRDPRYGIASRIHRERLSR